MTDLLWADPTKENGRQPSKRGISYGFGPDIAYKFLDSNKLSLLNFSINKIYFFLFYYYRNLNQIT